MRLISGRKIRNAAAEQLKVVRKVLRGHLVSPEFARALYKKECLLMGVLRHYKPDRLYPLRSRHLELLGLKEPSKFPVLRRTA